MVNVSITIFPPITDLEIGLGETLMFTTCPYAPLANAMKRIIDKVSALDNWYFLIFMLRSFMVTGTWPIISLQNFRPKERFRNFMHRQSITLER